MKKILLALFLTVPLLAQSNLPKLLQRHPVSGQSVNLDGSSEYASKSSPVNLDLNGSEYISNSRNTGFETTGTDWAGNGNHSLARSTTDKKTGTYSLAVTSSAAGDATTNYASLASTNFSSIVSGKKYTLEGYARGTGVLGSELTSNGDFASDTWWGKDVGVTITSGVGRFSSVASGKGLYKISLCTSTKTYAITYTILNYSSGSVRWEFASASGSTRNSNGTYTDYIVADNATPYLVSKTAGTTLDVDNVSIKEVTLPTLTLAIGNQTKAISSVSCVSGTFTKLVWNFQATANEVNQPIKIYANQADIVYLDDVSLTQAYDALVSAWVKVPTSFSTIGSVVSNGSIVPDAGFRLMIRGDQNGYAYGYISDNITQKLATVNIDCRSNTAYKLVHVVFNRTGNLTMYSNGVAYNTADISGIGKVVSTSSLFVGRDYYSANYFSGNLGEVQITRFDDIATSNVSANTLLSAYKGGLGTWSNGNIVAWYKWRGSTDAQLLYDYSGNGNSLSGVNVTQSGDQERGSYPSK